MGSRFAYAILKPLQTYRFYLYTHIFPEAEVYEKKKHIRKTAKS